MHTKIYNDWKTNILGMIPYMKEIREYIKGITYL
jgi:hypothetical protein